VKRFDLLKKISEINGAQSYLEIGLGCGDTMRHLQHIPVRVGVDPNRDIARKLCTAFHKTTSEEFFAVNEQDFDLIFIDGDHRYAEVRDDLFDASCHLTERGVIVLHDMSPETEEKEKPIWSGDGWKAMVDARSMEGDLYAFTIDSDHGLGVVMLKTLSDAPLADGSREYTFRALSANRKEWLGLVSVEDGLKMIREHLRK
jgi:hypothetical protein